MLRTVTRGRVLAGSALGVVALLMASLTSASAAPPSAEPGGPPAGSADGQAPPRPVPLGAGDVLALGSPGPDGFSVLVPAPPETGGWAVAGRFLVPGVEADRWVGSLCTTGSGRFAALSFAPAQFVNRPALRDRGGFAATLDLRSGEGWMVPARVALKYHTPGCGSGDDVVFLRHLGVDQQGSEVLRVDPVRRAVVERRRLAGQLTSAVPLGGDVVAASGRSLVVVGSSGGARELARAGGPVFDLHPGPSGEVDFLAAAPVGKVTAYRLAPDGRMRPLAEAPAGGLRLAPGRAGRNRLVGRPEQVISSELPLIPADWRPRAVSLDGSLVVERVGSAGVQGDGAPSEGPVIVSRAIDSGTRTSETVRATAWTAVPGAAVPVAPVPAAANTKTPKCPVPRNDHRIQVMQPLPAQVEWAAHRAVRGELLMPRPPNWMNNGLPPYTPQQEFPRRGLDGSRGRIPVQVLLGILAQESNLKQASYHALPGVPGNPLVADYYGVAYGPDETIVGMDYDKADCGYGIAQVTDHMTVDDDHYTVPQKTMIATDYAANMAAGVRILEEKWNQARAQGLIAHDGDPSKIENWYFAIWGYNTGIYPDTGSGPYGVGWTNNPANADYPPDRQPFLRQSYEDAAHPGDWPYQERVLGWAEHAQIDYRGEPSYAGVPFVLAIPSRSTFCVPEVNDCDPDFVDDTAPDLSYCQREDRKCWWHGPKRWFTPEQEGVEEYAATYRPVEPEPPVENPHPPSCTGLESSLPASPDLAVLPPGAVIVDDIPDGTQNLVGCPGVPPAGTFDLNFGTNDAGAPLSEIDFHQIGAGLGGHFWFAHTNGRERPSHTVTGTWTPPPGLTGWTRILVHIPDHGADSNQADYQVSTGARSYHRVINQRWNQNVWHDLGAFELGPGAKVSLSNETFSDYRKQSIDIAWDAIAFVPTTKPSVSYVAFGDSYSAGEGVEPYYANADNGKSTPGHKNACHRSPLGYPVLVYDKLRLRHAGASEFHFQACSGAVIPDLLGPDVQRQGEVPQLFQGWLDENTTHVTLTIGGNDAGFGDIIRGCIATTVHCLSEDFHLTRDGAVDPEPLVHYEAKVIAGLRSEMVDVLAAIKASAPRAAVTFVGYPHVIWHHGIGVGLGCGLLDQYTRDWFTKTADQLISEMHAAAGEAGVMFIDVRGTFETHEACTTEAEEWINAGILYSSTGSGRDKPGSGSFHPNRRGHEEYHKVIAAFVP